MNRLEKEIGFYAIRILLEKERIIRRCDEMGRS